MSGTTWTKFFWSDWESDPALRLCSLAAQGLWMRMLCIAAAHDPIGYVAVAGRGLDETSIARMTGGEESETRALLGELAQNGVYSLDRQGRIYSRRMVNDAKKAAIAKKNGKTGGNPNLRKTKVNPASDKGKVKASLKPQKPLSTTQEREESKDPSLSARESKVWPEGLIPDGFPDADAIAEAEGWIAEAGATLNAVAHAKRFRNNALTKNRDVENWPAAWRQWVDIELETAPKAEAKPPATAVEVQGFDGPAELRAALVRARNPGGGAWAVSWIDPCKWDEAERALIPPTPFHARRLRADIGSLLADMRVSIGEPQRSVA